MGGDKELRKDTLREIRPDNGGLRKIVLHWPKKADIQPARTSWKKIDLRMKGSTTSIGPEVSPGLRITFPFP